MRAQMSKGWFIGYLIAVALLAAIGAPLGWCVLHTVMAFHYADIHYFDDAERDLEVPGRGYPGPWDFLYFSFTISVAVQTSDVCVGTRALRKTVLAHSVIGFLFNAAILGLSINIAASLTS